MKNLVYAAALLAIQLAATPALAQTTPADRAAARADRKAEGREAARNFAPGEGNPRPAARPRMSSAERAQARPARRAQGIAAARAFEPGEGDPKPAARARMSREERSAGRRASRAQVASQNRAGRLPSYGEGFGGR